MTDTRKHMEVKCGLRQAQNTFANGKMLKKTKQTPPNPNLTNNNRSHSFLSFAGESATTHPQTHWSDHHWSRHSGWLTTYTSTTVFFGKGNIIYTGREQNIKYTNCWACFASHTISAGIYVFIVNQRSQRILLSKQFHSQKRGFKRNGTMRKETENPLSEN